MVRYNVKNSKRKREGGKEGGREREREREGEGEWRRGEGERGRKGGREKNNLRQSRNVVCILLRYLCYTIKKKTSLSGVTVSEMLNRTVICPISPSAVSAMIRSVCGPASNLDRSMEVSRAPVCVYKDG